MKIRTDFVTNSSSSSFSVSIVVETEEKEFKVSFEPDEDGNGKANLRCTAENILSVGSVSELATWFRASVCDEDHNGDDEDYDDYDGDEGEDDDDFEYELSGHGEQYSEDMKYFANKLVTEIPSLDKIITPAIKQSQILAILMPGNAEIPTVFISTFAIS